MTKEYKLLIGWQVKRAIKRQNHFISLATVKNLRHLAGNSCKRILKQRANLFIPKSLRQL